MMRTMTSRLVGAGLVASCADPLADLGIALDGGAQVKNVAAIPYSWNRRSRRLMTAS